MNEKMKNFILTPESIKGKLLKAKVESIKEGCLKQSAVLVPIFERDENCYVLFTKRSLNVEAHKGEISFPGGLLEQEDKTLLDCALRETEEELGIRKEDVKVLGELSEILTLTGFKIKPYVGWIDSGISFKVNQDEIEELIELELMKFLEKERLRVENFQRGGKPYPIYYFNFGEVIVWGATAKIMKNLIEALFELKLGF